jgi:hypothetical protein
MNHETEEDIGSASMDTGSTGSIDIDSLATSTEVKHSKKRDRKAQVKFEISDDTRRSLNAILGEQGASHDKACAQLNAQLLILEELAAPLLEGISQIKTAKRKLIAEIDRSIKTVDLAPQIGAHCVTVRIGSSWQNQTDIWTSTNKDIIKLLKRYKK